ncbi:MAG: SDR family oxidoreductase [Pyrinomonadaceae bacterium MAG19_C2-C3]|nr:SDR family oxidoreductase [Pyrinomonadaceae bacterium MAG19_C2-C3]
MPAAVSRGFTERVALVVGGGREANTVARAVAIQLALEGSYVIVAHEEADEAGSSIVESLRALGTLAHAVKLNRREGEDIGRVFDEVDGLYGRLDLMVNVALIERQESLIDATVEDIDACLGASLRSSLMLTQYAARMMRRRGAGGIVHVVGAQGKTDTIAATIHGGIIGLTESAAGELAPRIRINGVVIGHTRTGIKSETGGAHAADLANFAATFGVVPPDNVAASADALHPVAADEVARAVLYLLSPESKFIIGQILNVGIN